MTVKNNEQPEDIVEFDLPELNIMLDFPHTNKTESEKTDSERLLDTISEISKQGYAFLKENDTKNASLEFLRILDMDAHNNYALVGLGDAARKEKKIEKALSYYEECLKYHPDNNYVLFGLADCYKSLHRYKKAIAIWERYLQLDDTNIAVLTRVADAYRKVSCFDESKQIYQRVLDLSADNTYALIGLGHLYYDFKKYREALGYWQRVLTLSVNGADIRILTSIGNCYRKLKNFEKALPFFLSATDKEPKNFYALFGIADCYRGLGRHDLSINYWKKILAMDADNKVILTRLGDAYRNVGDFDEAERTYIKAVDIAYDSYAMLGLAILKKEKGLYSEAITSLTSLLQQDRKNYRIYLELADCYRNIGDRDKALEVLDNFRKFGIRNPHISDLYASLRNSR